MKIALIGNPNTGKSTLFNTLTGSHQHTGNWPGKTVDMKTGSFSYGGKDYSVVDLPGIYSLNAMTIEEQIARDYINKENPDVVVDVVDCSNIERNLYLAMQLIELEIPLMIVLNFGKEASSCGFDIDAKCLSRLLGVPIVSIEAKDKKDIPRFVKGLEGVKRSNAIPYGGWLQQTLEDFRAEIKQGIGHMSRSRLALGLLEKDPFVMNLARRNDEPLIEVSEKYRKKISTQFGDDAQDVIADARYGIIHGAVTECKRGNGKGKKAVTKAIDRIVTGRIVGIPLFLVVMWAMFQATFTLADPLVSLIDSFFTYIGGMDFGLTGWAASLVSDGIIAGVGGVLVFLPNIFMLFFLIALLEDSGYLARVAFIMDKSMRKIGLQGKSFIPMIIGFGCNVPGVMAARTLQSERDRLITILINPFMSCSARLPVYVLFVSAFFVSYQGLVIFSLYLLGILVAVGSGWLFKKTMFQGSSAPFIMELPPYRIPTLRGVLFHSWNRTKQFIKKAGTIILSTVVLIWFLGSMPWGVEYASENSLIGMIGSFFAPLFSLSGFGHWKAAVALVFGVIAKEVVVGTMGTLYGVGEQGLVSALGADFTPLSAYSFMVLVLLYIPCIATLAVIRKETGKWRWVWFSLGYTMIIGLVLSIIVYQGGVFLGLGP